MAPIALLQVDARVAEQGGQGGAVLLGQGDHRQAEIVLAHAGHRHGGLDRRRVGLAEHVPEQREQLQVLAAGLGSRLRREGGPPKPLLPVAGRPLVLRVLDLFARAGVREAVIVLGFRGDEVAAGIESAGPLIDVSFVENLAIYYRK